MCRDEKKLLQYFQWNPGCFIWILIMAYYNPHATGWYNPLHTLNNQGFFATSCQDDYWIKNLGISTWNFLSFQIGERTPIMSAQFVGEIMWKLTKQIQIYDSSTWAHLWVKKLCEVTAKSSNKFLTKGYLWSMLKPLTSCKPFLGSLSKKNGYLSCICSSQHTPPIYLGFNLMDTKFTNPNVVKLSLTKKTPQIISTWGTGPGTANAEACAVLVVRKEDCLPSLYLMVVVEGIHLKHVMWNQKMGLFPKRNGNLPPQNWQSSPKQGLL